MLTKKIKTNDHALSSAFLFWNEGEGRIQQKEVGEFLSLGRSQENLLVVNDNCVSRRHARIEKSKNKKNYIIKDMGSENGVLLNGTRVKTAILNHNDTIKLGNCQFHFSYERFNQKWQMVFQSRNKKWNEKLNRIPHIAASDTSVLILGPSGVGKELIAQMIHNLSRRSAGPMVSINCSALTESLVESELFGHTKGSYTGSSGNRKGAFLTAHKGSLFMDEVGDLPMNLQPKLLRAIEYKEIKPIGSDTLMTMDTRIISATHQNLNKKIIQKEFRRDLFFRLNVVTIQIPALIERMEDFPSLLQYFCMLYGVNLSNEAIKIFSDYHWPGNIRELKNTIERVRAIYCSEVIDKERALILLDHIDEAPDPLWRVEKKHIMETLKIYRGNQVKSSESLDMPRSSLCDKIKLYEIDLQYYKNLNL